MQQSIIKPVNPPLQVQSWLIDTGYSCYVVEQIHGGKVNFTFRGDLNHTLKDGTRSIILKQSRTVMAMDSTIFCPLHRCRVEELILRSLSLEQVQNAHENVRVRTPRHYCTILRHNSHLQIFEEFPASKPLRTLLHCPGNRLTLQKTTAMGHALGAWLSWFHHSGCDRDPTLASALKEYTWVRDIILPKAMTAVEKHMQDFPRLFEGIEGEIRGRAEAAFMMVDENGLALRHGDLNIGNIIVSVDSEYWGDIMLGIVDWEACHYGRQHHDLAMLLAGLISVDWLHHTGVGGHILEGLLRGYPVRSETTAFCIAAALGVWLFMWPWWSSPPSGSTRDLERLTEFARDLMTKALQRERTWIEDTFLAPLFKGIER